MQSKLSNDKFTGKAPQEVVERERQRAQQLEKEVAALKEKLERLG